MSAAETRRRCNTVSPRCEVSASPHPIPQRERTATREQQRQDQQPPRRERWRRCGWYNAVDRGAISKSTLAAHRRVGLTTVLTATPKLPASTHRNPKRNTRGRVGTAAGGSTLTAIRACHSCREKREYQEPDGRVSNHSSSAQAPHRFPAAGRPEPRRLVSPMPGGLQASRAGRAPRRAGDVAPADCVHSNSGRPVSLACSIHRHAHREHTR
jgi:hypothetical protein